MIIWFSRLGAKVGGHYRYVAFRMTEAANPKSLFADILPLIAEPLPPPIASTG